MKKRVADIVVDTLLDLGITETFCVVGGGAMHLNNAFGINKSMHITYCHHEQACSFAAEGYAKYSGKMACVSVTAGPGGVNALNGVYSAWVDSTPMIVIAGFPRYETSVPFTGLNLRCRGVQEFDIVNTVKTMTKYSKLILDPKEIKYEIVKAYNIAMSGRRGPVWLSIPLDVQAANVDDTELEIYNESKNKGVECKRDIILDIARKIKNAKRPCVLTGSGIRYADAQPNFINFLKKVRIPIVGAAIFPDALPMGYMLYYGGSGMSGPRTGNYILQNADLILVLGNSLSTKQTGFNVELFAPDAYFIMIDAEKDEMKKPGLHIDCPVEMDLKVFFELFDKDIVDVINADAKWIEYCDKLYDFFKDKDIPCFDLNGRVPCKIFGRKFVDAMPHDGIIALGNSPGIAGVITYCVKNDNQRVIVNYNAGSMGDDLPEAIGIAKASGKTVYCITGDGSIMMNIQELQTIRYNKLPIKIVVLNNNGYGAIRNTCKNFFNSIYAGCDSDSGISFPSFKDIASTFDFKYIHCEKAAEIDISLRKFFETEGNVLLEVEQLIDDPVIPKVMSKMDENGKFITPSLLDMYPYLTEKENCIIESYKYF